MTWLRCSGSDPRALTVVDGTGPHEGRGPHYSRRTPGSPTFVGVGRDLVLVTDDGSAVTRRGPDRDGRMFFVVLWNGPSGMADHHWHTHAGSIMPDGRVDLYWGHYDFDKLADAVANMARPSGGVMPDTPPTLHDVAGWVLDLPPEEHPRAWNRARRWCEEIYTEPVRAGLRYGLLEWMPDRHAWHTLVHQCDGARLATAVQRAAMLERHPFPTFGEMLERHPFPTFGENR